MKQVIHSITLSINTYVLMLPLALMLMDSISFPMILQHVGCSGLGLNHWPNYNNETSKSRIIVTLSTLHKCRQIRSLPDISVFLVQTEQRSLEAGCSIPLYWSHLQLCSFIWSSTYHPGPCCAHITGNSKVLIISFLKRWKLDVSAEPQHVCDHLCSLHIAFDGFVCQFFFFFI